MMFRKWRALERNRRWGGVKQEIDRRVAFIREAVLRPYCDLQGIVRVGFIVNVG